VRPVLLPALEGRVPGVEALALRATLPVLQHHAAVENALDPALPGDIPRPVVDVPGAEPEVELPPGSAGLNAGIGHGSEPPRQRREARIAGAGASVIARGEGLRRSDLLVR